MIPSKNFFRCARKLLDVKLQFQLTVSITAVVFSFASSVTSGDESSALTAVQLLWVNLIQDTLAALALATDPPTLDLLDRPPEPKGSSLISFNMWKMIFGQSIVQLAVIFTLNFAGPSILFPDWDDGTMKTMVFNTFVWLQIFNEINCRRIDDKLNVFFGMHKNPLLVIILFIMVTCQILIIFLGGAAFSVTRLNAKQWLISVTLGFLTIPTGAIVRLIPNAFIRFFIPKCILRQPMYIDDEGGEIEDWEDAIEAIHEDLVYFKKLRSERRLRELGKNSTSRQTLTISSVSETVPLLFSQAPSSGTTSPTDRIRRPTSGLYSIAAASTIVPGLIALSPALVPHSTFTQHPRTRTSDELLNERNNESGPS
jgi:P-type Ca2+ transporter type 2C